MAQLVIRNLDDEVKERLRRRAAEHGVSMEAEARRILGAALDPRKGPRVDLVRDIVEPLGGIEIEVPTRSEFQRPVALS